MRSLLLPLAVILAIVTGLGLLGVAATVTQAPIAVAPPTAAAEAAVRRFYEAADVAFRSGNPSALRAAVTPDYVDHATPVTSPGGVVLFARFLADLREVCPDCRLMAQALVMSHDQAAVRVEAQGYGQGTALDFSADGLQLGWPAVDVLRIAEGRIAERWSHANDIALTEPLYAFAPLPAQTDSAVLQIARFALPSGASLPSFRSRGTAMVVAESGALSVRTDGAARVGPGPDAAQIDIQLGAGKRLVLTPDMRHTVRNDGPTPAVVLIVAIDPIEFRPKHIENFPHRGS